MSTDLTPIHPQDNDAHLLPEDQRKKADTFLQYYDQSRGRLYGYLLAMVYDPHTAEELLQESSLVLWREFDKFEQGTNFWAWASIVALNRVRNWRRKKNRNAVIVSDDLVDSLAAQHADMTHELDDRWDTLQRCLQNLRDKDAEMIRKFYTENMTAQNLADEQGRSIFGVRKSIHRIRKQLHQCVDTQSAGEENT